MKIHMVKQGDTLYLIAKKYNVPLEELVKANSEISNPDAIEVGMKVKIPSPPKTALGIIHQHIVQQGDTLWKLSKAWGIQLADLIKANPQLKNPNALLTGEVVNIPETSPAAGHPNGAQMPANGTQMPAHGIPGKANTGAKPGTGTKAETGVMPAPVPLPAPIPAPAPMPAPELMPAPMPMPMPLPMPMPAPEPIVAQPKYGMPEHVPYMTYPVPTEQVGPQTEMPCPEETHYGYGAHPQSQFSGMNAMPYDYVGYGHSYEPQSVIGPGTAHADHSHGYGYPAGISPLGGNIGGLYTPQDYSYSPPNPVAQSEFPGMISPTSAMNQVPGCKSCGGSKIYSASYSDDYPGSGYAGGTAPYMGSPYAQSPYSQYPYGQMPIGATPYGGYPGVQSGAPMGDIPLGIHSMNEGAQLGGGYGMPVNPYAYGGIPQIPPIPPLPPLREEKEFRGDPGEKSSGAESASRASAAKKRQPKPKARISVSKPSKPKSKESLPWIKW